MFSRHSAATKLARMAPPCGAALHQPDGKAPRGLQCGEPAARGHEIDRAAKPLGRQRLPQPAEISRHHRLDIGIGHGRRGALIFAHLRADLARQGDGEAGPGLGQDLADPALVAGIGIAVEEGDCEARNAEAVERRQQRQHRRLVQRLQHLARGIDALRHREAAEARDQGLRLVDEDVVLVVAPLIGDIEDVAETLGGDEGGDGALALDDGVGRQGRAVEEEVDLAGRDADLAQQLERAGDHRLLRRLGRGQQLARPALVAGLDDDVGEGAADIDGEALLLQRSAMGRHPAISMESSRVLFASPPPLRGRVRVGGWIRVRGSQKSSLHRPQY